MSNQYFNEDEIPKELKDIDHWVCWKLVPNGKRMDKLPFRPHEPTVMAATNKREHWSDFETAKKIANENNMGVGFVFTSSLGLVGVDLDKGEAVPPELANVSTYTEKSVSGNGLHLFVKAGIPVRKRKVKTIELFHDGFFLTVSGNRVSEACEIASAHEEIGRLYSRLTTDAITDKERVKEPAKHSDKKIVRKIQEMLTRNLGRDPNSEDDFALACAIAECSSDPEQIERIMRKSVNVRSKWDERRGDKTYLQVTIDKAMGRTELIDDSAFVDSDERVSQAIATAQKIAANMNQYTPVPTYYGWLIKNQAAILTGNSGSGKSTFLWWLIGHYLAGLPLSPYHDDDGHRYVVPKQGAVLLIGPEGMEEDYQNLGYRFKNSIYLPQEVLWNERLGIITGATKLESWKELYLTNKSVKPVLDDIKKFKRQIGSPDCELLVVFDTLARCVDGLDENDNTAMTEVGRRLEQIAREGECTVLTVHHPSKAGMKVARADADPLTMGRGAGGLSFAIRTSAWFATEPAGYVSLSVSGRTIMPGPPTFFRTNDEGRDRVNNFFVEEPHYEAILMEQQMKIEALKAEEKEEARKAKDTVKEIENTLMLTRMTAELRKPIYGRKMQDLNTAAGLIYEVTSHNTIRERVLEWLDWAHVGSIIKKTEAPGQRDNRFDWA